MATSTPIAEKPAPAPEPSGKSVESRLGDIEKEFATFQARIDVMVSMLKWIGGFVAAALLAVVVQMFSVSFAAGRLQEKVDAQGVTIQEIKTELREIKKDLTIIREELQKQRKG